jgi:hypothetical protein
MKVTMYMAEVQQALQEYFDRRQAAGHRVAVRNVKCGSKGGGVQDVIECTVESVEPATIDVSAAGGPLGERVPTE